MAQYESFATPRNETVDSHVESTFTPEQQVYVRVTIGALDALCFEHLLRWLNDSNVSKMGTHDKLGQN
jgi:hypothetical protein